MVTFQDPAGTSRLDAVAAFANKHSSVIGAVIAAPFNYRRLTRAGAWRTHQKLAASVALGTTAVGQLVQRSAVRDAVALDPDSYPAWHTSRMLPLMVRDTDPTEPLRATLGRTSTGPVVVFDAKLLKTGTTKRQLAAYRKAAEAEKITRPEVALPLFAGMTFSSLLLRRAVLGPQQPPTPVSGTRAAAYLAANVAQSAASAALVRHLKRPVR